jgi:protein SCO1/2
MNTPSFKHSLLFLFLVALTGASSLAMAHAGHTGHHDLNEPAEAAEAPDAARLSPRYLLQDARGRAVMSEDFKERFQLIAFGFTGCPDVCPTAMLEMQQVMSALGERAKQVQPIFISVDPERDTGPVLEAYTQNFDKRIIGLTGKPELVRWAANNFKVKFEKVREPGAAANVYTMDHTTGMFLLGPDGQRVARFAYGTSVKDVVAEITRWQDLNDRLPKK